MNVESQTLDQKSLRYALGKQAGDIGKQGQRKHTVYLCTKLR